MNLKWVWNKVKELWYSPIYLWLYGSQNYWIDTETSDFDYKCIVLPSLRDLVWQKKPVSVSIEFEWWLIDIKDIRSYIENAVKVNVNFIEILQTEFYIWDSKIRDFYEPLISEMRKQYVRACYWMMKEKHFALCKEYPSKQYEINKFWYDPKQLCHIVRLSLLINRCIDWNFNLMHDWEEKRELLLVKSWKFSLLEAQQCANAFIEKMWKVVDSYDFEDKYVVKNQMLSRSRNIIINDIVEDIRKDTIDEMNTYEYSSLYLK